MLCIAGLVEVDEAAEIVNKRSFKAIGEGLEDIQVEDL